MVIYCHGSLYFQTDVHLFHFHFYILIVYHREHVLIFSWHQKRSMYSCWMFSQWLFRLIKTTLACHSLHVLLLISSDLTALPSESRGRRMEKGKKGCCYILSSGRSPCWEPSRKGMYSIDPWMKLWRCYRGGNKVWYFCFQSSSFSFFKPLKLVTVFIMCV